MIVEDKYGMTKNDVYRLAKYALQQKDAGHMTLYKTLWDCCEKAAKRLVNG